MARCVGDVEHFEAEHWGRLPLVRRCAQGDHFADVWSVAALDEFLVGAVRRPSVRLVNGGQPIPEAQYTTRVRLGGSDFQDVIDPAAVARHFAAGATVVAQSIHRTQPSVRRFAEELMDAISHPIQANAYFTPPDAVGLAPHVDQHDVFVLQMEGSKVWRIDGLEELELHPGDTVYIPAHTRHSASATSSPSLHLTIGVLRVTYRAVLQRLLHNGPDVLAEALPLRYRSSPDELSAAISRMLADVGGQLQSVDPVAVAAEETGRRSMRPPRSGALVAAASISSMCAATVVTRSENSWNFSSAAGGRLAVGVDGCEITVPESCRSALEMLADGAPRRVGDLVGLDGNSQLILARRLAAAGFCVTVPVGSAADEGVCPPADRDRRP